MRASWTEPGQRTTQFMMLASASHISCTFIVWSFYRLTYSCSLTAGVAIFTFGKFATAWNTTFMASVSRCGWKRTCLGTSQAKAADTQCIVLKMVALLTPNKSPTTNWKLPHAKNRNATRTWSVSVSEPFNQQLKRCHRPYLLGS